MLVAHVPLVISDEFPGTVRLIHVTEEGGPTVEVIEAGSHMRPPESGAPEEGEWDTDWEAALELSGYEVAGNESPVHNNGGVSFSVRVEKIV